MKNTSMRLIAMLLAVIMVVGMFAGCGNQNEPVATDGTQANNETKAPASTDAQELSLNETGALKLMWYQGIGIDSIFEDPWRDQQSLWPYMVFDALVAEEVSNVSIVPKLATDWEISDDGKTVTLTLREGVKWHDGEDLTVEDVLFTYNAQMRNPNGGKKTLLAPVVGYQDVIDGKATELAGMTAEGNKIIFKLDYVDTLFVNHLAYLFILPEHLLKDVPVEELSTYEEYWTKPVGTGAYVIDKVAFPDYFTCVRNDNYWDDKAAIKNVQFTSYDAGGQDAVVAALINGDLDYASGGYINDMVVASNVVAQNNAVTIVTQPASFCRWLGFNLGDRADGKMKEDLQNPIVRQAFDMIVDKQTIASFFNGQCVALSTFCNPDVDQYNDDIPLPEQNIEKAVEMLNSVNYDFSQVIDIGHFNGDQTTRDIMALLVQDFAKAGITVKTHFHEGDLTQLVDIDKNFDLYWQGFGGARPCDSYWLQTSHSSILYLGNDEERTSLIDPLYTEYTSTTDPARAKELADQLQALDYQYRYIIPVYMQNSIVVYNSDNVYIPEMISEIASAKDWNFDEWSLIG